MPCQSGPGSNGNEGVLRISESPCITGTLPSDCSVSYPGHSLVVLVVGVLPLCRSAVSVFFSPSRLGKQNWFENLNTEDRIVEDYFKKQIHKRSRQEIVKEKQWDRSIKKQDISMNQKETSTLNLQEKKNISINHVLHTNMKIWKPEPPCLKPWSTTLWNIWGAKTNLEELMLCQWIFTQQPLCLQERFFLLKKNEKINFKHYNYKKQLSW